MSDTATTDSTDAPHGAEGEQTETPTLEDLLAQVEDLKKNSRKWEDRAKTNKDAADRLAALEREKMTDAEKAEADRSDLEQRAASAEKERDEAVAALARYKVATEFGLDPEDAEALASVSDEDALRRLAERLAGRQTGPKPTPAQGRGSKKTAPSTPAEAFAEAMSDLF